LVALNK